MNDEEITPPSQKQESQPASEEKKRKRKRRTKKREVHFLPERLEKATHFGRQILTIMRERGLSIQEVADGLQMNRQRFLYFLENNTSTLTYQDALHLASILDVNPLTFLVAYLVAVNLKRDDDPLHERVAELMLLVTMYIHVPDAKKPLASAALQALFTALGQEDTTPLEGFLHEP